jgi:hypothetical protein
MHNQGELAIYGLARDLNHAILCGLLLVVLGAAIAVGTWLAYRFKV